MPPKPKFADGEKVLCYHGNFIYEAKCVKSEAKEKAVRYFIHYNGWNKNWDEWVPETRVLKLDDAGLKKQKEALKANANSKGSKANVGATRGQVGRPKKDKEKDKDKNAEKEKKPKTEKAPERASTPSVENRSERAEKRKGSATADRERSERGSRASTPTVEPTPKRKAAGNTAPVVTESQPEARGSDVKKKRTRVDTGTDSEDTTNTNKPEFRLRIPDELKPWLVDDGDLINRQKKLVALPCSKTVDDILEEYVKVKLAKGTIQQKDVVSEITLGIKDYFNVMLGTQLLYRFERIQYQEILADHADTPMCKIYGANHLLRLFVKLGGMLEYTPLDEKSMQMLSVHLHDVLKYMAEQSEQLFNVDDYQVAPPEYHRKAL